MYLAPPRPCYRYWFKRRFDVRKLFFLSRPLAISVVGSGALFPHGLWYRIACAFVVAGGFRNATGSPLREPNCQDSSRRHPKKTFDHLPRFLRVVGYLVLGLASGLEAFSREPPCDSVGALAARQTPETSGMAWEFLSYYPILPSRYLRDPPAISLEMSEKIFLENKFSRKFEDAAKLTPPIRTQKQSQLSFALEFLAIPS